MKCFTAQLSSIQEHTVCYNLVHVKTQNKINLYFQFLLLDIWKIKGGGENWQRNFPLVIESHWHENSWFHFNILLVSSEIPWIYLCLIWQIKRLLSQHLREILYKSLMMRHIKNSPLDIIYRCHSISTFRWSEFTHL